MPPPFPPGSDPSVGARGTNGFSAPRVVIVGASARAAAFSAIRAGLRPICFDQFADVDLQAFAQAEVVDDYPHGLIGRLDDLHDVPLIYTGAMENHPDVLRELALSRPVLGNDEATLGAVRDPFRVHDVLSAVKVDGLDLRTSSDPPPPDGTWLLKPLRGGAGRGIAVWDETAADSPTLHEPHYFQQRGTGETISAVYLAAQDPLQVRYVGLTRQLVGLPQLNAPPFAWCGSIGPVVLDTRGEILSRRIGTVLAHQFGLKGIFGCDFVLSENEEPLLVEVNPRYTGSVEVLEHLCGSVLIEDHCRATGWDLPDDRDVRPADVPISSVVGKAVLYSDRDLLAPDTSAWKHITPWEPLPGIADLCRPGSVIRQGSPVCTLFALATSFAECEQQLLHSTEDIRRLLADCPTP